MHKPQCRGSVILPGTKDFSHVGLPSAIVRPERHPALLVHLYGGAVHCCQPDVHDQKPCKADEESQVHHEAHKDWYGPVTKDTHKQACTDFLSFLIDCKSGLSMQGSLSGMICIEMISMEIGGRI